MVTHNCVFNLEKKSEGEYVLQNLTLNQGPHVFQGPKGMCVP